MRQKEDAVTGENARNVRIRCVATGPAGKVFGCPSVKKPKFDFDTWQNAK